MTIDDTWKAICENPDDDEPRLRFATLVEPSDPEWSSFIRRQIDAAHQYRGGDVYVRYGVPSIAQAQRWARNIAMFTRYGNPRGVEFFRGFPAKIDMYPEVFVENAELLFRLAPIQHVQFHTPCDDDWMPLLDEDGLHIDFPLDDVLACPQLARLDRVIMRDVGLRRDSAAKIAACPHLSRCLYLDLRESLVTDEGMDALAAGPLTGKMLALKCTLRDEWGQHTVREGIVEQSIFEQTRHVFGEKGKELEARYGYIPWLHDINTPSDIDIRWYADQGLVPKFPAGSQPVRDEWYEMPPTIHHRPTW